MLRLELIEHITILKFNKIMMVEYRPSSLRSSAKLMLSVEDLRRSIYRTAVFQFYTIGFKKRFRSV